jgi:bifunctional DNA-binding transcriptional regulator/antitoxin component of YhaV-PrlF toxin-antitoxin module
MTYHTHLSTDGSLGLPGELLQALGIKPGDRLTIAQAGNGIVVRRDDGRDGAIARLRTAMNGYSVDAFLAERAADGGE